MLYFPATIDWTLNIVYIREADGAPVCDSGCNLFVMYCLDEFYGEAFWGLGEKIPFNIPHGYGRIWSPRIDDIIKHRAYYRKLFHEQVNKPTRTKRRNLG